METQVKVPIIILTKDHANGVELQDYLISRFPDKDLDIHITNTPSGMMDSLTHKHYNIVVVDYDKELYEEAERLVYEKKKPMAISLFLSSEYDVQFIFRKPGEHHMETEIELKDGMTEMIVKDQKDHESVARLIEQLLSQRVDRKDYNVKNVFTAAALLVFFIIIAIVVF